jgi:hypothetical protein
VKAQALRPGLLYTYTGLQNGSTDGTKERTNTMNSSHPISLYQVMRQFTAVLLCVLLLPFAQLGLYAQAPPPPPFVPLEAVQLDQLVSPIALYPDALVAQILTASTYPDQVGQANNWEHQNIGLPPDQLANLANTMPWDPSVKALTAFPSVLDNLARNYSWAQQLGNAYYNQPADVMNAVQATRYQAQQAGMLVSTPQQRVYVDAGSVVIVPVNPGLVYVPYYNPWRIWGPTFVAYPGYAVLLPPRGVVLGLGIGFAVGISIGLFAHYGWGWGAWAPNWHGGVVLYNHGAYYSRSVTVYNHGHFGGYNRGVFEHEGRGVPGGYHASVARADFGRPEAGRQFGRTEGAARPEAGRQFGRTEGAAARPEARAAERPGAARPEARAAAARPEARPAERPAARAEAPRAAAPAAGHEGAGHAPAAKPAAPAAHGGGEKRK